MAKTLVERVDSPVLDVTIFKISGTLGYHENQVLTKFFNECSGRGIDKLILDFSDLGSLGGGCAKIIRDAASGKIQLRVAGASKTVQSFLEKKGPTSILFSPNTEAALSEFEARSFASETSGEESSAGAGAHGPSDGVPPSGTPGGEQVIEVADVIQDVSDVLRRTPTPAAAQNDAVRESWSAPEGANTGERLRRTARERRPAAPHDRQGAYANPSVAVEEHRANAAPQPVPSTGQTRDGNMAEELERKYKTEIKELKRSLVQYKWLFSLNADFSTINDKRQLLDAFLLTTIAQVGVESAAFLELVDGEFVARCWKGFETADPTTLNIALADVDLERWLQSPRIFPLEEAPLADSAKQLMDVWDLPHAAPFVVRNRFRGLVLLGRPIRGELDAQAWEFLGIMISQVAIAYESSCRLETESERTLGLVQSLISMIECNTMSRGTTQLVMDLAYAVAVKMHYDEEHIRDLMFGTVLRDIGMIKTGNLIVRSPRELMKEEWDIIKQHPVEGAEILERMGFSEHTRDVVMYHHERYNGEGYPCGLAGAQIPLGARILSVVESYVAMLQDRPIRSALSREEAVTTLNENWGMRYDPQIVEIFIDVIEEEIRGGERPRYRVTDLIKK